MDVSLPSMFTHEEEQGSPFLEAPAVGIRINVNGLSCDAGTLRCRLLLTYCFARTFYGSFESFQDALVLVVENAHTGEAFVRSLEDPYRRYPARKRPNFKGSIGSGDTEGRFITSWINLDLEIPLPTPSFRPSVFLTVLLQEHVSNTVGLDLLDLRAMSYLDGMPHDVALADLSEGDE